MRILPLPGYERSILPEYFLLEHVPVHVPILLYFCTTTEYRTVIYELRSHPSADERCHGRCDVTPLQAATHPTLAKFYVT